MELIRYPEKVLRKKCPPVREIDDQFLARAEQMLELMYDSEGLGLAGPQVDWARQVVTLDVEGDREGPRIFVNPRIADSDGYTETEEGCLSLPGVRVEVPRAERVTVVAYTATGKRVELELEGLAAIAWQHEIDHLNGTLIIDRLSQTRLMTVRDRLKRLEREAREAEQEGSRA